MAAGRAGRRRPTASRLAPTACLSPRARVPRRRGEEHLLAPVGVPRREREQRLQPVVLRPAPPPGRKWSARRRVVICSRPSRRAPGGELDQPAVSARAGARAAARGGARAPARRRRCVRQRAARGSAARRARYWRACRARAAVAAGIGSSFLRYGLARRPRPGASRRDRCSGSRGRSPRPAGGRPRGRRASRSPAPSSDANVSSTSQSPVGGPAHEELVPRRRRRRR